MPSATVCSEPKQWWRCSDGERGWETRHRRDLNTDRRYNISCWSSVVMYVECCQLFATVKNTYRDFKTVKTYLKESERKFILNFSSYAESWISRGVDLDKIENSLTERTTWLSEKKTCVILCAKKLSDLFVFGERFESIKGGDIFSC